MMRKRNVGKNIRKDKSGIVGIGTLIVFIAMVLVAAIAAAVIIQTAAQLQQRAERTTSDTVHDLGVGLQVKNIIAHVDTTAQAVDMVFLYFELNPGAEDMDLQDVTLFIQTEGTGNDTVANLMFRDSHVPDTLRDGKHFYVYDDNQTEPTTGVQIGGLDPNKAYDATATPAHYYVDQDCMLVAQICLGNPGLNAPMAPGSSAIFKFIPAGGGTIGLAQVRIPGSLDTREWITLE